MRTFVLLTWLALPVAGVAYHYGPGQDRLLLDDVAAIVADAEQAVADEDWATAVDRFDEAVKALPADHAATAQRLRLERAKAQMQASNLPAAAQDLAALLDEMGNDDASPPELERDARQALANAQFYMTWLLRLEGKTREEWEPEVEAARQHYRLLAEDADARGDRATAQSRREDLEATIRLARLELSDLQGLPLPCQCQGCCNGRCNAKKISKNKGKKKGDKPPQDVRSAGSGPPPDGSGS